MKKPQTHIIIILSMFLLSACARSGQSAQPDLEYIDWLLTTYNESLPVDERQPTIRLENGKITGTTGCNHYGGNYQITGDTINFEGIFSTEMACLEPEGLMEQELVYLELLRGVDQFELNNGALTFYTKSLPILFFEAQTEAYQSAGPITVDAAPTSTVVSLFVPPENFKLYQDSATGISVYIPGGWIVTSIIEGQYAILQSFPEDKYVGGEMFEGGDAKCDLNIQPVGTQVDDLVNQLKSSDIMTILAEEEFLFPNGVTGKRFQISSMGTSITFVTEINSHAVLLTCFGDFSTVDVIASTLQTTIE